MTDQNTFTYASLCDGIGAVHCAWQPLGWRCAWTAENAAFPAAVVAARWSLPNLGDITASGFLDRAKAFGALDVLAAGTPCPSFSSAGLRLGMEDPRGRLAMRFIEVANENGIGPRLVVWENVAGVLLSNRGRDFGALLGALVDSGYGVAWRVLDAGWWGTPQTRRRVYVVGCSGGNAERAAAILFDAATVENVRAPGEWVPAIDCAGLGKRQTMPDKGRCWTVCDARGHRFLTPRECERLQGFADDYTLVEYRGKPAADGPRYRALGNSMAVPVMRWIGRRIAALAEKAGKAATEAP